ncbi:hypothetical protein [Flavobacterium sp. FlaQc-48]|uniref:hypothetical protein n=1 Tax=Flavobacterium sp. FlaQc-48 TaxID=3374181 RepID=UPI003756905B
MSLGEIYFYVLTGLVLLFSAFIYLGVEDLKLLPIFKKLILISFLIQISGFLLVFFDVSRLSVARTIFIYSLPIIVLLLNRVLFWLNDYFFGEPFVYAKNGFLQGFWYNKVVDKKSITLLHKIYYFYCTVLHLSQIFLYSMLFHKFK